MSKHSREPNQNYYEVGIIHPNGDVEPLIEFFTTLELWEREANRAVSQKSRFKCSCGDPCPECARMLELEAIEQAESSAHGETEKDGY